MGKKCIRALLASAAALCLLCGCAAVEGDRRAASGNEAAPQPEKRVKITLNEVAHSIFYAPLYVAIEKGYFAGEGVDLELTCGFGADKTMAAVLSGEADVGFMGSEASIYTYNEGAADPVVNFAQLTQRAGNFLVAREKTPDFSWEDLKGKTVLGGRKGGMPEMVFEYILKKNNIEPFKDIVIDQGIDFGSTAAAFTQGQGDYTVEFEPAATLLERAGKGFVTASLGEGSGFVPYTAFCAKRSYIEKHPDIIQRFTNALQKGLNETAKLPPAEIAEIISPQFPEATPENITAIVARYADQKTWKENLIFEEPSFALLLDILETAGELKSRAPYGVLVDTSFAEKALNLH